MSAQVNYQVQPGQELTQAKAIEIAKSKGTVTVTCGDASARVVGGGWFSKRTPTVSWASYGPVDPDMASDMARVMAAAAVVARQAETGTSQFDTCPPWVCQALGIEQDASELVRYRAASRYNQGDATPAVPWRYAIELTRRESKS